MTRPLTEMQAAKLRAQLEEFDRAKDEEAALVEGQHALLRRAREGNQAAQTAILSTVSSNLSLAVPIVGVIKVTSDPPEFQLQLGGEEPQVLSLGGVEVLDSQLLFGRAFLLNLGWKPSRVTDWDGVVTAIASCAVRVAPDEAMTKAGRGARWIATYLRRNRHPTPLLRFKVAHGSEWWQEARQVRALGIPFRNEQGVNVFLASVVQDIREASHGGESPSASEVAKCLEAAGCQRLSPKFPKPNTDDITTVSAWLVPETLMVGE